jgi:hypothetical protein
MPVLLTSLGISAATLVCLGIFGWYSGWRARIRGRVHAQFETIRVISLLLNLKEKVEY